MERIRGFSSLFLRLALGLSFFSALADRFGLWGAFGQPNVSWGNFARFVAYTGKLNWFLPEALIPALAIIATCAEALLGLCLVIGWRTRSAALLSGILLILFGVTMTVALGVKEPLSYSVFSAAGGAFLLATCTEFPFGVDWLRRRLEMVVVSYSLDHAQSDHLVKANFCNSTRRMRKNLLEVGGEEKNESSKNS